MKIPFTNMYLTNAASFSTVRQKFLESLGWGVSKDGKRDLNTVYGYSTVRSFKDYFDAYRYGDIAKTVIDAPAKSCWRGNITIENEDNDVLLEGEMAELKRMGLFRKLEATDILNRIGRYSVLFVIVPDGQLPEEEIGTASPKRLSEVAFAPYAESGVMIDSWETDPTSPRFGLPLMYNLQQVSHGEKELPDIKGSIKVHWTRIVHMAEGALDSEIEGASILEAILNRLEDINKVVGGAAEAYFRNARQKIALEVDPKYAGHLGEPEKKALAEEAESFQNNWSDILRLSGITANALEVSQADPQQAFEAAIKLVSGTTGIPMRMLIGIGVGQMSGTEDKASYNERIDERREGVCSVWLWKLLGILSSANMISDVRDEGKIVWPEISALSEKDAAEIMDKVSNALVKVSVAVGPMGGLAGEMSAEQAITEILGMEYEPETFDGLPEEDVTDDLLIEEVEA